MSAATKATGAKRVAKKEETVAAPVAVAAPAAAAPAKESKKAEKKAAPAKKEEVAAPAPVAAAPVASAVAVVAEAAGPSTTLAQDIEAMITATQAVRDGASKQLKALQALQKRVARELKEAGRKRRRNRKAEDGEVKEKRPSIFTTPVTLKDDLATFLGKSKGSQMAPADVSKAIGEYIETHKLKNQEKGKGHTIYPDAAMRKALGIKEGEAVTYRNIQGYLYKQYVLPAKKA